MKIDEKIDMSSDLNSKLLKRALPLRALISILCQILNGSVQWILSWF